MADLYVTEEPALPITATGQAPTTMPATYDLRKILSFLSIVGVVVVISALGAFVISSSADKTYAAEAQIVVTAGLGVDPNGDVLTAPRIGQTYATLAMTRPVLLEVSKQAKLPYDPIELARHIRVSADPVSPFISISATDGSPTRAEQMANALADILVEKATIAPTPDDGEQAILEIVERAIVPDEPSGPRVLLNTVLAATAALVLALAGVALVAYLGGDRLYRPETTE